MGRVPAESEWDENCPDKFVEAIRDQQAPLRLEGVPVGGLLGHGFRYRIDQPVTNSRIIGPARHQSPPQQV
jgi:hypothetical protein